MKWQQVNDTKFGNKMEQSDTVHLVRGTKHMNTARIHARILARSKDSHASGNCLAFGKTWTKCSKKNHLSKNSLYIQAWQSENQKRNQRKAAASLDQLNENSASDEPDSDESIYSLLSSRKQEAVYCRNSRLGQKKTKLTFKSNFNLTQEPHAAPPL